MNSKLIKFLVISIGWAILFGFSTRFILFVTGNQLNSSDLEITNFPDNLYFGLDEVSIEDNIFSTTTISGWAFIESQNDNSSKFAKLILASTSHRYEVDLRISDRRDLPNVLTDVNTPLYKQGFRGVFSPVGLENGEYELYILVHENSTSEGFVNTGRKFLKNGIVFSELKGGEILSQKEFDNLQKDSTIKFGIDQCKFEANKLVISGWTFKEGFDSTKMNIAIQLVNSSGISTYLSIDKLPRQDIRRIFNNGEYYLSGFKIETPIQEIFYGKNQVKTVINHQYISEAIYTCDLAN